MAELDRPVGACVLHAAPQQGYAWRRADPGYVCCEYCYGRLQRWLSLFGVDDDGQPDNIATWYALLDPRPGSHRGGRRAPGFGPRSPANDHVIALGDARTAQIEDHDPCSAAAVLRQWVTWVWDERYENEALDQPDYRSRRGQLPIAVVDAAGWLSRQLDWITRQDIVVEFYAELVELRRQLRAAAGASGQPPVGYCIESLEQGQCRAPLFMPRGVVTRGLDEPITVLPQLCCPSCGSVYTGTRLIKLRRTQADNASHPAA